MSVSPAVKKLQQARIYLRLIRQENQKGQARNLLDIEAHVSSCFGHIKAAFYRLRTELGPQDFMVKKKEWKNTLTEEDRAFFNRMIGLRDLDVHTDDIPLSIAISVLPAHLDPDMTRLDPPDSSSLLVQVSKFKLEGEDVAIPCERFLALMERLVEYVHPRRLFFNSR
jgi:hypothetical protein